MKVIAIDGPAGAGKSSVARAVATRLGLRYLDTGAMYRAVAVAALDRGIDPNDADAVRRLVEALDLGIDNDSISVDGVDVTARIRGAEVTAAAAQVARHEAVRRALVRLQRQIASGGQVVMEGRDIGSAVLPDADVKVFLTASLEERARRRCRQLGEEETPERVAALVVSIDERDEADRSRAASPLVQADEAVVIDTTRLTEDQVVERIAALASEDVT